MMKRLRGKLRAYSEVQVGPWRPSTSLGVSWPGRRHLELHPPPRRSFAGAHHPSAAHESAMAAASTEDEAGAAVRNDARPPQPASNGEHRAEHESDDESDDDADEEPKLKYTRLTASLAPIYRNGDATSTFMVAGDKMVRPSPRPRATTRRRSNAEF